MDNDDLKPENEGGLSAEVEAWLKGIKSPEEMDNNAGSASKTGNGTARVFLHTRKSSHSPWTNEFYTTARIPVIGEYIALDSRTDFYFRVQLVVHTPFPCDCDAEVYAVGEWRHDVLHDALRDDTR